MSISFYDLFTSDGEEDQGLLDRAAQQADELDQFLNLLTDISSTDISSKQSTTLSAANISSKQSNTYLSLLENAWKTNNPLGWKTSWDTHRGPYGETVLHWLAIASLLGPKARDDHVVTPETFSSVLGKVTDEILDANNDLMFVPYKEEPYCGETSLHMAIAVGYTELAEKIIEKSNALGRVDTIINEVAVGSFFQNLAGNPLIEDDMDTVGVTALDVAMLGAADWDSCQRLMDDLLKHGAKPYRFKNDKTTNGSVLHTIARQQFVDGDTKVEHVTAERLEQLYDYMTGYFKTTPGKASLLEELDDRKYSAFQVAAHVGNEEYICTELKSMAVPLWTWGRKSAVRFSLKEIEQKGVHGSASAYEILALQKHIKLLRLKVFAEVTNLKWEGFGRFRFMEEGVAMFILAVGATLTCMGDHLSSFRTVKVSVQAFSLVFAIIFCILRVYHFHKAPGGSWLHELPWFPRKFSEGTLMTRFELIMVFDMWLIVITAVTMTLNIASGTMGKNIVREVIDIWSGMLVFTLWLTVLEFLKALDQTGLPIAVIPKLLRKDLIPWLAIWGILSIGTCAALSVTLSHTPNEISSIRGAFDMLIKGTFAPDLLIEALAGQPLMACVFILVFAWVGVVALFNILIAMFTDTYEEARETAFELLMHQRTVFVITAERLMPARYRKNQIGAPSARRNATKAEKEPLLPDVEHFLTIEYEAGQEPWRTYDLMS